MNYASLGTSQLKASVIGFGCMSLPPDESSAMRILQQAIESGINYFDTADIYQNGNNEVVVGKALKGQREKLIIATKVGNVVRADGKGLDWNPTKEHILKSVDGSLRRLQTDYIDLYQLHGGTINDNISETIEAFDLLKQQGKILYYGISSIRPNVIAEYIKRSAIVSVMMQYSLLDRRPEEECLDLLHDNGIAVLVRGSIAQGLLVNKPAKPYLELSAEQVKNAAEAIKSISNEDRTPTQTAIRYVLQHPAVTSAVVGIRTSQQLQEVTASLDTAALTNSELQLLRDSIPALKYKEHRIA